MDKDRRTGFLTLKEIEESGKWVNLALSQHIMRDGAKSPAFVRELVYGCIRQQKLLDYNISRFLKKPKLAAADRVLLRMGFYQLAFMDGVADHAAVSETVAVAKAFKKGQEGFINAVLRSFQRDGKRLLDDGLATRYSCAQWIIDLWTRAYGAEKAEELLRESCKPAPLTIRVNTMRMGREELAERLAALGFEAARTELSGLCLTVSGSGLLETAEYRGGLFSVQGEASALAVELLAPRPGAALLDLCSAPGGKTCAAAELMQGRGSIAAFDIYTHRLGLVEKEARRLGFSVERISSQASAAASQQPGSGASKQSCSGASRLAAPLITLRAADCSAFMPQQAESADFVIADVPCSGLGTLRRNPEIKLKEQSAGEAAKSLEELTKIQYNIMLNSARYLRPGGRLLYSTCTVDPAENEELVRRVLAELRSQQQSAGDTPQQSRPVPQLSIEKELQLFPTEGGPDGFYICVLTRQQ